MSAGPRPPADAAPTARRGADEASYDFAETHKEGFRALAGSMSFVGVCTLLFGGLLTVFSFGELYAGFVPSALGTAFGASLCLATGWWTMSAGRSLSALVGTRGRDVEHLMEAVAQFRRLFGFARVVIVMVALLAVAAGCLLLRCMFVLDRGGKCFGISW